MTYLCNSEALHLAKFAFRSYGRAIGFLSVFFAASAANSAPFATDLNAKAFQSRNQAVLHVQNVVGSATQSTTPASPVLPQNQFQTPNSDLPVEQHQKFMLGWRLRQTRGVKQKEPGPRNPEQISSEGQKDLIDIMKPH
jgi:hypothetical protein